MNWQNQDQTTRPGWPCYGKRHIVTSQVEHSSVLNSCMTLERDSYRVTYLPVDRDGLLKPGDLEAAIPRLRDQAAVVSRMWANHETGVLFPAGKIAAEARERSRHNFAAGSISIRTRRRRQNPL